MHAALIASREVSATTPSGTAITHHRRAPRSTCRPRTRCRPCCWSPARHGLRRYRGGVQVDVGRTASGDRWRVEVRTGGRRSEHTVAVPDAVAEELGYGPGEVETLVRASFAFLLAREPPSSILRTFSIEQIGDYFSDYPAAVRRTR